MYNEKVIEPAVQNGKADSDNLPLAVYVNGVPALIGASPDGRVLDFKEVGRGETGKREWLTEEIFKYPTLNGCIAWVRSFRT